MTENKKSNWKILLRKAIKYLSLSGVSIPWTLGGGTSLFLEFKHRFSQDIDIFLPDPQALGSLSPRIMDEIYEDEDFLRYGEQTKYIKLYFTHGEIDFVVAGSITECSPSRQKFEDNVITIDHPAEVVFKKLFYRGELRKTRDAFDTAVVYSEYPVAMIQSAPVLGNRLNQIRENFEGIIKGKSWKENVGQEIHVFDKWRPIIPSVHDICALFFSHAEHYCKTGEHRDEASLKEEVQGLINGNLPTMPEAGCAQYDGII